MSNQKNVVFLSRLYYPHVGGVEKHVEKLSDMLVAKGYKVTIITEKYHKNLKTTEIYRGVRIVRISVSKSEFFKKFSLWLGLLKYLPLLTKADVIHCHDVFFWMLPYRLIFPFKKIYTTFHGYEGNSIPTRRAIFMHRVSAALSNGNLTIGSFYKKWYGTRASQISYGAVDVVTKRLIEGQLFHKKVADRVTTQKKKVLRVLYIGRLVEEAGIRVYLEALTLMSNKNTLFKLFVLGDGVLLNFCIRYAKKNNINVHFKGFEPNADGHISKFDICFVSRYLSILEALAQGKPVFAVYNNEIKKDYLLKTPFSKFITICKSADELTNELLNYGKNPNKYNKITRMGYEWAKTQTWEVMAKKYERLWGS